MNPFDPTGSTGPQFASQPAHVLVAGGGIAAIELVVTLRTFARDRVTIEVLAPDDELVYRPLLVAEPFGFGSAPRFPLSSILADQHAVWRRGKLASVQPGMREVTTDGGERFQYDALVVATGARTFPAIEGALTFSGPADVAPLRDLIGQAERGEVRRLAFALPAQEPLWPLPLYELALMTAARVTDVELVLVTPEQAPLELFGSSASDAVRTRLEQAGIELRSGVVPEAAAPGELRVAGGGSIPADAVVALPGLDVPHLPGLPQGSGGFIAVDEHCRVEGLVDVYAAGDLTDFRVKQGGFAARQAQAAAAAIGARAGALVEPDPLKPELHGLLLSGKEPSYIEPERGASSSPLWWPPTKIASSYLVPYLVSRFRLAVPTPLPEGVADLVALEFAHGGVPARRPTLDQ